MAPYTHYPRRATVIATYFEQVAMYATGGLGVEQEREMGQVIYVEPAGYRTNARRYAGK